LANKYEVTFQYIYEDCEVVHVIADTESEAQDLAESERSGPNWAWDHASVSVDDVYSIGLVEEDVEENVDA